MLPAGKLSKARGSGPLPPGSTCTEVTEHMPSWWLTLRGAEGLVGWGSVLIFAVFMCQPGLGAALCEDSGSPVLLSPLCR